jgi:autoinducer 2-degrading protein
MAYVVTALWHAEADKADRVAELVDELARTSRGEPGCVQFQPNRHAEDPVRFLLYEEYADETAFEAHSDSEHFKRLVLGEAVPDLLEDRERIFWRSVGEG